MKTFNIIVSIIIFLLLFVFQGISEAQSLEDYKKHVEYLSSDELEGRGNFQPGIWTSAAYIQSEFVEIGLTPLKKGGYFQQFPIHGDNNTAYVANVIGYIPAKTKTKRSIIYVAHYDGYRGVGQANEDGDKIYNAAIDNASGVAALIELAKMFAIENPPEKNIIFIATAAEELGSFGSKYYLEHPLFPVSSTDMVINIDGFNLYGEVKEVIIMPVTGISFRPEIIKLVEKEGFEDNTPDWVNSLDTKFDSHRFLQKGVPTITIWAGDNIPGMTAEEAQDFKSKIGGMMHTQEDEINEFWDWGGVESHLKLHKTIGDYYLKNKPDGKVTERSRFIKN